MPNKYQVIIQDILEGIENHRFKRGQKLPSIRHLSQVYKCSKDTVQKAMMELKYQHRIYAVEKSGYYILEDQDFQDNTVKLNPDDFQHLPYEDFRSCLNESLIGRENYLFNYYHQQEGLEELIDSFQRLLMDYDVYTKKDQLVITAGSQQALYILTQMDFGTKGTDILLEEPTYHRMRELVEHQGLAYQTIERTLEGIDLDQLEAIFKTGRIKCFYTIPRLHNPLGTTYHLETKKAIIRLAQRYKVYIIEDDYLADFDSSNSLPLHYLDTDNKVIYIKSFTPTLFPALRIGGVSLPHKLVPAFLSYKSLIDYDTNLIMQKALSLYIDNGMFARNSRHLFQQILDKRTQMEAALASCQLAYPYQLATDLLTIQLPHRTVTPQLKHSQLGIEIISCPSFSYLQLPYSQDFKEKLQQILTYLH